MTAKPKNRLIGQALPTQTLTQLRLYWLQHRPKIWRFPSKKGTSTITTNYVQRCLIWRANAFDGKGCTAGY
jgi:hypothetical protein